MAGGTDLVTFNVGGRIYTVLREPTLSLHPNSLLTQLAEDRQQENEIFVEGGLRLRQWEFFFVRLIFFNKEKPFAMAL